MINFDYQTFVVTRINRVKKIESGGQKFASRSLSMKTIFKLKEKINILISTRVFGKGEQEMKIKVCKMFCSWDLTVTTNPKTSLTVQTVCK